MKRLLWLIVAMAGLVAVVTGCDGMHRYDGRLEAADSLMHDDPDSALALVEAIDAGSLTTAGDRAYRDLLLTQARYRCYIAATSDSAINRALAYYRAHDGEREKLTRCYLYKGAVMGELGQVDSAMFYYKTAEVTAAPDDYFNLGQINTRIASLYRTHADKQVSFDKYGQALHYYEKTGDKLLQLDCLYNMAGLGAVTCRADFRKLLNQAERLATELNDSLYYFRCQELRCRQLYYLYSDSLIPAKRIAINCLQEFPSYVNNDLLLDLADIYAHSGMADSAMYYLNYVNENAADGNSGQVKTRKCYILTRINRLNADLGGTLRYESQSRQLTDSIDNNKEQYVIQQIENEFNQQQSSEKSSQISSMRRLVMGLIIIIVLLAAAITAASYLRRLHNTRAIIRELENANINDHHELMSKLDSKNSVIERMTANLVELIKMFVDGEGNRDSISEVNQQIKDTITKIANEDFWNELSSYLDKHHNNIITDIQNNYSLTEKDIRLIELSCCGFDYIEIAIILGYSPRSVSNKRKLIEKKMKLDKPLIDHLNTLMVNEV